MAMTLVELQAFIDSKPDTRNIVNEIADYLQANPGGGGVTLYSGDGALSSERTVDLNGKNLDFNDGGPQFLSIHPLNFITEVHGLDGTADSYLAVQGDLVGTRVEFELSTTDGVNTVELAGDAIANTLAYTADTHTFNGKIINPNIVASDFANDGAAAIGGIGVGEFYHTAGTVKVRLI